MNAIIPLEDKILFKKPSYFSKPIAKVKQGRLLIIQKCDGKWCKIKSGIYNVGSGQVTSFNNLINYVFKSLEKKKIVEYIEMPPKLKKQYQNYTRADISKLRGTGYMKKFTKVEHAVSDYILNYLV